MSEPNAGEGWYEWTTPSRTTEIAYVHEGGSVYDPVRGWDPEEFTLAAARGLVHRLIRADEASLRAPTPEEIEAAARAIMNTSWPNSEWDEWAEDTQADFRNEARAALIAALSARNTRETNG